MECTDLMLDDWVLDTYTGKPMRVPCVNIKVGKGLEPIPLTEDILVLNGFYKRHNVWIWANEKGRIYIQHSDKWSIDIRNEIAPKDDLGRADLVSFIRDWAGCFYVHDLQHAILICGMDKEINL